MINNLSIIRHLKADNMYNTVDIRYLEIAKVRDIRLFFLFFLDSGDLKICTTWLNFEISSIRDSGCRLYNDHILSIVYKMLTYEMMYQGIDIKWPQYQSPYDSHIAKWAM